jgi:hypothetical protein
MLVPRCRALVLGAALLASRGLLAQSLDPPPRLTIAADQTRVSLTLPAANAIHPYRFVRPEAVRALYVNAWAFASDRLWRLVRLADSTDVNALVIDVKDDTGCLLYPSSVATARESGANACARSTDSRARLDTLRAHGIYAIARIVVAKDPLLAEHKPTWAIHAREGGLWRDRLGSAWVDAYNDSVWAYAGELAREAVGMGFSEVQFDYVRFPDEPRSRMRSAVFAARTRGESPRDAVRRHVALLVNMVRPFGVPVTFDVFGLSASVTGDLGVGQVWEDFSELADVVLPMVYPSHYGRGEFGFLSPNAHPYEVVRLALGDAVARTRGPGAALIRPYLQAFTLGRHLPRYTSEEIRQQILATRDAGIESWVLWNPRSVYHKAALPPYSSSTGRVTASGGE